MNISLKMFTGGKIWIAGLLLLSSTILNGYGQGDIVLKFRHKTFPGITRKLNVDSSRLFISAQDTLIDFTGGLLLLSDGMFIKQTRYDSIAIPLEDIRSIKKSKDMLVGMGGVLLTGSAVVLGIDFLSGTFNEQQDLRQAWTPYIALAAGSGALIAIGTLRSNYNLRRWQLVAIEDNRIPLPQGMVPP
jgi:hypothetical protein